MSKLSRFLNALALSAAEAEKERSRMSIVHKVYEDLQPLLLLFGILVTIGLGVGFIALVAIGLDNLHLFLKSST